MSQEKETVYFPAMPAEDDQQQRLSQSYMDYVKQQEDKMTSQKYINSLTNKCAKFIVGNDGDDKEVDVKKKDETEYKERPITKKEKLTGKVNFIARERERIQKMNQGAHFIYEDVIEFLRLENEERTLIIKE